MSQLTKTPKGTLLGLRFGCGGLVGPDGAPKSPALSLEEMGLLELGDSLRPCNDAIVINLGTKGKITLKQLQGGLERAGWMMAVFVAGPEEQPVQVRDPLCPIHGILMAKSLLTEDTPEHLVAELNMYIARAQASLAEA